MNGSIALSLKRINVFAGEGYKHMADKACLGLPRKIHGPWDKPLRHRQSWKTWKPPHDLESKKAHAMPPLCIFIFQEKTIALSCGCWRFILPVFAKMTTRMPSTVIVMSF